MTELALLIFAQALYDDMASLCDDTPECRAFFWQDQQWAIQHWKLGTPGIPGGLIDDDCDF